VGEEEAELLLEVDFSAAQWMDDAQRVAARAQRRRKVEGLERRAAAVRAAAAELFEHIAEQSLARYDESLTPMRTAVRCSFLLFARTFFCCLLIYSFVCSYSFVCIEDAAPRAGRARAREARLQAC
jgi:hypothetical protein